MIHYIWYVKYLASPNTPIFLPTQEEEIWESATITVEKDVTLWDLSFSFYCGFYRSNIALPWQIHHLRRCTEIV